MTPVLLRGLCFLALLACLYHSVEAGNCSQFATPIEVRSFNGGSVLHLYGYYGSLFSAVGGNIRSDSLRIDLESVGTAERNKIAEGAPWDHDVSTCITPDNPFDPFTSGKNSKKASEILPDRWFNSSLMDCYAWTDEKVVDGVRIRGAYVRSTSSIMPSFELFQSYEFADKSLTIFPNNDTTYTNGTVLTYEYVPNVLKVSMNFRNYSWAYTDDRPSIEKTYLSTHIKLSTTLPAGAVALLQDTRKQILANIEYPKGGQRMTFSFDKLYLVDGTPYAGNQSMLSDPLTFGGSDYESYLEYVYGVGLCHPTRFSNWVEAHYDPQLSAIFVVDPPSNAPGKPKSKKYPLIIGLTFMGVIILIVAIVLLVLFVPALRAKFMPMRHSLRDTTSQTSSKPNTTRGSAAMPAQTTAASAAVAAPAALAPLPTSPDKAERRASRAASRAAKREWKQSRVPRDTTNE